MRKMREVGAWGVPMMVVGLMSVGCGDDQVAAPGANSVIETEAVASGDECANGGVRFMTGIDDDGDGTIDEITNEVVVCHGADGDPGSGGENGGGEGPQGPAGPSPLVSSSSVASHDDCDAGATVVEVGYDTTGDDEIDDVADTFVICDGASSDGGAGDACGDVEPLELSEFTLEEDFFGVHEVGTTYELSFHLAGPEELDGVEIDLFGTFPVQPMFTDAGEGMMTMEWTPDGEMIGDGTMVVVASDGCSFETASVHVTVEDIAPRALLDYERDKALDDLPAFEGSGEVEVCLETRNVESCEVGSLFTGISSDPFNSGCQTVTETTPLSADELGELTLMALNCVGLPEVGEDLNVGMLPIHWGPGLLIQHHVPFDDQINRRVLRPVGDPVEVSFTFNEEEFDECELHLNETVKTVTSSTGFNEVDSQYTGRHQEVLTETTDLSLRCEASDGEVYFSEPERYIVDWGITRLTVRRQTPFGSNYRVRATWVLRDMEQCQATLLDPDGDEVESSPMSDTTNYLFDIDEDDISEFSNLRSYEVELRCENSENTDEWTERIRVEDILEDSN